MIYNIQATLEHVCKIYWLAIFYFNLTFYWNFSHSSQKGLFQPWKDIRSAGKRHAFAQSETKRAWQFLEKVSLWFIVPIATRICKCHYILTGRAYRLSKYLKFKSARAISKYIANMHKLDISIKFAIYDYVVCMTFANRVYRLPFSKFRGSILRPGLLDPSSNAATGSHLKFFWIVFQSPVN